MWLQSPQRGTGDADVTAAPCPASVSPLDSVALKLALTGKGGSIAVVAQASSATTPDPDLSNNVASLTTTIKKK